MALGTEEVPSPKGATVPIPPTTTTPTPPPNEPDPTTAQDVRFASIVGQSSHYFLHRSCRDGNRHF